MEEECEKYEKYEMEVRRYSDIYTNNLHATWNLIKNLKKKCNKLSYYCKVSSMVVIIESILGS